MGGGGCQGKKSKTQGILFLNYSKMLSLNLLVVNIMSEEDANVRRDIAQLCNMFSLFCAKPLLTYTQESTGKIILQ